MKTRRTGRRHDDSLEEDTEGDRRCVEQHARIEKRISRQQDLIAKQSTTTTRLRRRALKEEVEKEQRTLEKMRVDSARSFSFSQVEAKTTMVKADRDSKKRRTRVWRLDP